MYVCTIKDTQAKKNKRKGVTLSVVLRALFSFLSSPSLHIIMCEQEDRKSLRSLLTVMKMFDKLHPCVSSPQSLLSPRPVPPKSSFRTGGVFPPLGPLSPLAAGAAVPLHDPARSLPQRLADPSLASVFSTPPSSNKKGRSSLLLSPRHWTEPTRYVRPPLGPLPEPSNSARRTRQAGGGGGRRGPLIFYLLGK